MAKRVRLADYSSFAECLRAAMGDDRQLDVARAVGVTQGRVSRWLAGFTQPGKPDIVVRVAEYLGVPERTLVIQLKTWKPTEVEPSVAAELRAQNEALRQELVTIHRLLSEIQARLDQQH